MKLLNKINPTNLFIRREILIITGLFLLWRIFITVVAYLSTKWLPIQNQDMFLGGGFINYNYLPTFFGWANFDGEHFLSIAIFGYKNLEQAFFPLYPLMIGTSLKLVPSDFAILLPWGILFGLLISNLFFLIGLIMLWELIRLDYSPKVAYLTIILVLVFPTSFFFGAVYSESLFFALSVSSFYFARKGRWFWTGILGCIASTTRVFGIVIFIALLFEVYRQKIPLNRAYGLFLIPIGLVAYMIYQWLTVGDPVAFYHLQKIIGEHREQGVVLFPTVVYRYFKMLMTVDRSTFLYQTLCLEFITAVFFLGTLCYGFIKKVNPTYLVYGLISFILPTIQGSFSSVPRYGIVIFPVFLVTALILKDFPKWFQTFIIISCIIALSAEVSLFIRGYWVS